MDHPPTTPERRWRVGTALLLAGMGVVVGVTLIVAGLRLVRQPERIRGEVFRHTLPTTGPYTGEELKRAEEQFSVFAPPERVVEGARPEELKALAEANRRMDQALEPAWQRERERRLQQALGRRPIGWMLVVFGSILLILWTYAAWRFRAVPPGSSSAINGDCVGEGPGTGSA